MWSYAKISRIGEKNMPTKNILEKFITAQKADFDTALSEIKNGHKESHWIWYIFPQIAGL